MNVHGGNLYHPKQRHPREPSVLRELARNKLAREAVFDTALILGGAYVTSKFRTQGWKAMPYLKTRGARRRAGEAIIRTLRPRKWRRMQAAAEWRRLSLHVQRNMGGGGIRSWTLRKALRKQNVVQSAKAARHAEELSKAKSAADLGKVKPKRNLWTPGGGYSK